MIQGLAENYFSLAAFSDPSARFGSLIGHQNQGQNALSQLTSWMPAKLRKGDYFHGRLAARKWMRFEKRLRSGTETDNPRKRATLMHALGIIELTVVMIMTVIVFRPRRKPHVHPVPPDDSALLRRIQLSRKG
jgi:hypothetical protein